MTSPSAVWSIAATFNHHSADVAATIQTTHATRERTLTGRPRAAVAASTRPWDVCERRYAKASLQAARRLGELRAQKHAG